MGRYRRYRSYRTPSPTKRLACVIGTLLFLCGFVWLFTRPGMLFVGNFLAPTPTSTSTQNTSIINSFANSVAVVSICLILLGIGGLGILFLVWRLGKLSSKQQTIVSTQVKPSPTKSNPLANSVPSIPAPPPAIAQNKDTLAALGSVPSIAQDPTPPVAVTQDSIPNFIPAVELPPIAPKNNFFAPATNYPATVNRDNPAVEAKRLLTGPERSFFWTLSNAVKNDYYIIPQIPLRQLLTSYQEIFLPRELQGMLKQGVADFVVANANCQALAVIELDDSSHDAAENKARDRRKDAFVQRTGIPIIRFPSRERWDALKFRQQIDQEISAGRSKDFLTDPERTVFQILHAVRTDLLIFPKVSLRQFLKMKTRLSGQAAESYYSDAVDFILCHPRYLSTLAVIELGKPSSDNRAKRHLLEQTEIPIVYLDDTETWDAKTISPKIQFALERNKEK